MPYTKNAVTSLAQGVSQQAESQRHPSQAVEQINAFSSHIKGLVKRPPTKHIAALNVSGATGGNSFIHTINRDSAEQYVVVVNKGTRAEVRYDTTGAKFTYTDAAFHAVGAIENGSRLTFFRTSSKHLQIVTGLEIGKEYFVRDLDTSAKSFKVAATSGGAAITTGMVELTRAAFSASGADGYKAGLLIESVRLTGLGTAEEGLWIDGVLTVRFGSITSSPGHDFVEGDKTSLQNIQGTAGYIYQAGQYLLTQQGAAIETPAQMVCMHRTASDGPVALRPNEVANKFWLKNPSKQHIHAHHYGYALDGDQLPDRSDVGWTQIATELFEIDDNQIDRKAGSTTDLSVYKPGQLMKIGRGDKNPRAIVASSTTTTITFVGPIELSYYPGAVADTGIDVHLQYWSNKNDFAKRYFIDTDYRSVLNGNNTADQNWAYAGQNGGFIMAEGGEKGTGPYLYDVQSGEEIAFNRDSEDSQEAIEYLLNIENPATDLKAATVGDTTFLVNTTETVRRGGHVPHEKRFEAFIQVQQADYGKTYRINIGGEAVDKLQKLDDGAGDPATGSDPVNARALLYGAATADGTTVPICAIRAKKFGAGFDDVKVRLVQNWQWEKLTTSSEDATGSQVARGYHALTSKDPADQKWHDLPPNTHKYGGGTGGFNAMTGYARFEHVNTIEREEGKMSEEEWSLYFETQGTERAAVFYTPGQELTIFINFPWFKKGTGHDAVTTTVVEDIKNQFARLPRLRNEFEVVECDSSGIPHDEAGSTIAAGDRNDWIFHRAELHKDSRTAKHEDIAGRPANWQPSAVARDRLGKTYAIGKDSPTLVIGFLGWSTSAKVFVTRSHGLQSPSLTIGENSDFPSSRLSDRGSCLTAGGTGTVRTTEFGHGNNKRRVYDGEFFYKTPKWTGNQGLTADQLSDASASHKRGQRAIGTQRVAEMLGSNCYIAPDADGHADYKVPATKMVKADGRVTTDGAYNKEHQEEGLGLTFRRSDAGGAATMIGVLQRFSNGLERVGGWGENQPPDKDWKVIQKGNVIAISNPSLDEFQITIDDDFGGDGMSLTFFEVDESVKLPEICRHGHVVKVVGDAREEADDYYLRFESDTADSSRLSHGRWVETIGYGEVDRFADETMPVVLIREFDEDGNRTFSIGRPHWNRCNAGDKHSNPFPSFEGNTITDIFLHKNRLGVLSGENVVLSEAGEYMNFFRTTVATLLDSAPIDVTAATNKVSHLKHAIPYANRLLLFSPLTQFSLTGEPFLSPKSASITVSSHFVNSATAPPVLSGSKIFFTFPRTLFGGVSDYGLSPDQLDTMANNDITAHVPKYIDGTILSMSVCSEENILAVLTDKNSEASLYVYKYFLDSQGGKTQSAWFKYQTGKAGDQILAAEFIANTLYLVISRNNKVFLESMLFEDNQSDAPLEHQVHLDRRRLINGASPPTGYTVSYNSTGEGTSTVVIDYVVAAKEEVEIVLAATGARYKAKTLVGDSTLTFNAVDLTGQSFFLGEPYTMEYTFSKPYLRKNTGQQGRGVLLGGRQQLTRGVLEFTNAKSFDVTVTHQPQNTAVTNNFTFGGVELGYASAVVGTNTLSEGFFPFGIMGRNDRISIKLTNSTPYPADFLSLDYEGRVYARGARWTG